MRRIDYAWPLLKQTFADYSEDKVPRLGAALAFYTALSIAPLLVLLLRVAAVFLDDDAARGEIQAQMQGLVGEPGAKAIQDMIASGAKPTEGAVAATLGIITLLLGASGVFGQLQDSLNTIWEVRPKPNRGIWGIIHDRFFSFTMVLGVAFLLLVSLVISAALSAVGEVFGGLPDSARFLAHGLNFALSFGVLTVLFAAMYKWVPDVKIAWREVWLGAAVTGLLFSIGKFLIGLYLGHSAMASAYGVAGPFVVLLVWVYYSAQILFFGAELTQVYANQFGGRIVPTENAEPVPAAQRANEGNPRRKGRARSVARAKRR